MRFMSTWSVLVCAAAILAGCASQKPAVATAAAPAVKKVATPRDDCPRGYVSVSSNAGTACWPANKDAPPAGAVSRTVVQTRATCFGIAQSRLQCPVCCRVTHS